MARASVGPCSTGPCSGPGTPACAAVTLTSFRDVPWNAPFYQRVGFEVVDDPPPGLAAVRAAERAEGFDRFGPRVAMRLVL